MRSHVVCCSKIVFMFLVMQLLGASAQITSEDNKDILSLLRGLSDHSLVPSKVLDPNLDNLRREHALAYISDPGYQLSLEPAGEMSTTDGDSASIPVEVRFKNSSKIVEVKSNVLFVRRAGKWYFANYDFLSFPTAMIVVTVLAVIVGIAYASGVLLARSRLLKAGNLDAANRVKMFIPIFWPSFFRA